VPALGEPVLELLEPRAHERILDLGCGDGVLTRRLADLGCEVIGVDASPGMIAAALARGLDARVLDAHELDEFERFDAVFTNAALHWMRDPDRVVARVFRALRPGGRFVGECGADGNVATLVVALETALARRGVDPRPHNPWHFASGEEHRARLASAGFEIRHIEVFRRPTPLPGDHRRLARDLRDVVHRSVAGRGACVLHCRGGRAMPFRAAQRAGRLRG
jgi:SAM-dependent methyltransferase